MKGPQNKPSREGSVPAVSPTDGTRPPERRVPPLGASYPRPIQKKKKRARARRARRDSSLAPRASTRRAVSSGSCARRHRSVASAFCGPQSERLRSYWFVAGRGLTTRAPVRRGLETAPKRDSRNFFCFFFSFARKPLLGPPAAFGSRRLFVRGRQHSRLFVSRLSLCAYQSTKRLLLPPSTTRGRSRRGAREASALAGV